MTIREQLDRMIADLKAMATGLIAEDSVECARMALQTAEAIAGLRNEFAQYGLDDYPAFAAGPPA